MATTPRPPGAPDGSEGRRPAPDHPVGVSESDPFDALLLLALVCGAGLIVLVAVFVGMNGNSSAVVDAQASSGLGTPGQVPAVTSAPQRVVAPRAAPVAAAILARGPAAVTLATAAQRGNSVRIDAGATAVLAGRLAPVAPSVQGPVLVPAGSSTQSPATGPTTTPPSSQPPPTTAPPTTAPPPTTTPPTTTPPTTTPPTTTDPPPPTTTTPPPPTTDPPPPTTTTPPPPTVP